MNVVEELNNLIENQLKKENLTEDNLNELLEKANKYYICFSKEKCDKEFMETLERNIEKIIDKINKIEDAKILKLHY